MSPFATNLKKAREHKGWTQAKAAVKIGIPKHNIGAYEEDRTKPQADKLAKIMRTFGVTDIGFIDNPDFKMN